MKISPKDCLLIVEKIFSEECYAFIKSKEYTGFLSLIDEDDKNILRRNYRAIAKDAAQHYVDKYDPNLEDESLINKAFNDSIHIALKKYKQ